MSAVEVVGPKSNDCVELVPEVEDSLLASIDKEGAPESDLGGVGAAHRGKDTVAVWSGKR